MSISSSFVPTPPARQQASCFLASGAFAPSYLSGDKTWEGSIPSVLSPHPQQDNRQAVFLRRFAPIFLGTKHGMYPITLYSFGSRPPLRHPFRVSYVAFLQIRNSGFGDHKLLSSPGTKTWDGSHTFCFVPTSPARQQKYLKSNIL